MDSNRRGPVIVFAVLFGAVFLCLCLVVGAVALTSVSDSLTAPGVAGRDVLPVATPIVARVVEPNAPVISQAPVEPVVINIEPGADVESEILRAVYQKVNPSVVKVVSLGSELFSQMVPDDDLHDELLPQGQGSGFVWDEAGHIVTNAHVVEGSQEVQVVFFDDRIVSGEVLGTDGSSDLAVIAIDPTGLGLVPVARGDIDAVQVGDRAIAIGAPFDFAGSMTAGTVSGLGRSIRSLEIQYTIPEVIQTDAAINPGNSGGPLLNAEGEVIGINAQIRTEGNVRANSGVGFAIPIYIAERVVPALIEDGRYDHPFIGISGSTFSPEWAEALGFSPEQQGAYVTNVVADSGAEKAGLRGATEETDVLLGTAMTGQPLYLRAGGDLIVAIDDQPVQRFDDLLIYLFRYASPGDVVELTVIESDGSQKIIPVTLGQRPR